MVQPRFRALRAPVFLYSVDDVIDHLGGIDAVAKMTGRGNTAVHNWRALKRFPAVLCDGMMKALARENAIAPPELWSQEPCDARVA